MERSQVRLRKRKKGWISRKEEEGGRRKMFQTTFVMAASMEWFSQSWSSVQSASLDCMEDTSASWVAGFMLSKYALVADPIMASIASSTLPNFFRKNVSFVKEQLGPILLWRYLSMMSSRLLVERQSPTC